MSLITPTNRDEDYPYPNQCFLCHKELLPVFFHWAGLFDIGFHPRCLEGWLVTLKRDLIELRDPDEFHDRPRIERLKSKLSKTEKDKS
jgi:hypothetical protein